MVNHVKLLVPPTDEVVTIKDGKWITRKRIVRLAMEELFPIKELTAELGYCPSPEYAIAQMVVRQEDAIVLEVDETPDEETDAVE